MFFINVGYSNIVPSDNVIAILSIDSSPIKKLISKAKKQGNLIDCTEGRKATSALFCSDNKIILSAFQPKTLADKI